MIHAKGRPLRKLPKIPYRLPEQVFIARGLLINMCDVSSLKSRGKVCECCKQQPVGVRMQISTYLDGVETMTVCCFHCLRQHLNDRFVEPIVKRCFEKKLTMKEEIQA